MGTIIYQRIKTSTLFYRNKYILIELQDTKNGHFRTEKLLAIRDLNNHLFLKMFLKKFCHIDLKKFFHELFFYIIFICL